MQPVRFTRPVGRLQIGGNDPVGSCGRHPHQRRGVWIRIGSDFHRSALARLISEASRRAREQAANEYKTTRIVSARTFADIFGLKELGDVIPETATKVYICTIQGCRDAD